MGVSFYDVTKRYGKLAVLDHLNLELTDGKTYCLLGPSGSGKTTLLRLLMKLEIPDQGEIKGLEKRRISAVFQENRLCENVNAMENVSMTAPKSFGPEQIQALLTELLPEEAIFRPVSTLSGGMKRRTAVCRALAAFSDLIVMDEPFTGLDDDTKRHVISCIKAHTAGKLLIISTHQEEDVGLLDAIPLRLWS